MHLESPVSGSDRHSMVYLRANDGSAARPRGRGGRGRCFRWARAHDRSCGRSRTRTSRRDVQRRGKPERCIDRLGERGETLATESTFEPETRWRNRELRAHSSRVELARSPRRAKRRKAHRTEPCHVVARESLQRIARGRTSPRWRSRGSRRKTMLAMRRSKGRRRSSPHRSLSIPNKAAPKGEALREAAPVPSFDGRRFRPTRASPFSRKRVAAAVSVARPTTLRAKAHEGAHRSGCDGTSDGSASGRASGRQRPRARSRGACPTIGTTDRPDPEAHGAPWSAPFICTWLSGHAFRRAKACRTRSRDVARRPFSCRSQFVRNRPREWIDWVPVSTVSVADADRTHLWSCGSDRESGSGGVGMTKRGVESAQSLPTYAV